MAVTMQQDLSRKVRRFVAGSMVFKELTQKKRLAAQTGAPWMIWEQILEFVAENRSAARLENHDRCGSINWSREHFEDALEVFLGSMKHAKIVERTPTAYLLMGDGYCEASVREDLERCLRCLRMEVIIEGVHP